MTSHILQNQSQQDKQLKQNNTMGGQTDAMKDYRTAQQNVVAGKKMSGQEMKTLSQLERQKMSGAADESLQHYGQMASSFYENIKRKASEMASPNFLGRDVSAPAVPENK